MDDDGPVPAVLVAVAGLAGLADFFVAAVAALTGGAAGFLDALFSFVAGAFAVAETFFAAGTAFAAGAFFAAGLDAGVALAAVDATDCGIEGTVSCDSRDTRPPRAAGAGVAV